MSSIKRFVSSIGSYKSNRSRSNSNASGSGSGDANWFLNTTSNTLTPLNNNLVSVNINNIEVSDITVTNDIEITSDRKLKNNIQPIPETLNEKLMKLVPKQFKYLEDPRMRFGFIAQDIQEQFPNMVHSTKKNVLMDNNEEKEEDILLVYSLEMIPLLLLKIQDLQKQIDEMKSNE